MTPVEFEPRIPASKRLQTRALDRAATGIRHHGICFEENKQSNTFFSTQNNFVKNIFLSGLRDSILISAPKTPASSGEQEQMEVCIYIYSRQISV
jgi:hypothetical protein